MGALGLSFSNKVSCFPDGRRTTPCNPKGRPFGNRIVPLPLKLHTLRIIIDIQTRLAVAIDNGSIDHFHGFNLIGVKEVADVLP